MTLQELRQWIDNPRSTTAETLTGYESFGSFTFELVSAALEQVEDLIQDVIDLGLEAGGSDASQCS